MKPVVAVLFAIVSFTATAGEPFTLTSKDLKEGGVIADTFVFDSFGCSEAERRRGAVIEAVRDESQPRARNADRRLLHRPPRAAAGVV